MIVQLIGALALLYVACLGVIGAALIGDESSCQWEDE